jgi:hypothetical protein
MNHIVTPDTHVGCYNQHRRSILQEACCSCQITHFALDASASPTAYPNFAPTALAVTLDALVHLVLGFDVGAVQQQPRRLYRSLTDCRDKRLDLRILETQRQVFMSASLQ